MMRSFQTLLACGLLAALEGCSVQPPDSTGDDWVGPQGTWQEVFRDDFNGPAGSSPDPMTWTPEVNGKPDNNEQEYYTARPQNLALDGNGNLIIQAQSEHYEYGTGLVSDQPYTSGRMDTEGHLAPTYGRIEARIKLPIGQGMWPAFWMLGNNNHSVGWPACGEIDIFELRGSEPTSVNGSLHAPGYFGTSALTAKYTLDSGTFADDFHVFALEWTAVGMRWLVDEHVYHTRTKQGMADIGKTWIFDHPFFVLLNLAVGGDYGGNADSTTQFPAQMVVDYVSVSTLIPPSGTTT